MSFDHDVTTLPIDNENIIRTEQNMLSISSGGFLLPNSAQTVDKLLPYAVKAETSQNQDIEYNESDTTLRPRSNTISG